MFDDADIVESTKERLEKLGYKISSYIESIKGFEALKINPEINDLIITDHTIPKMVSLDLAVKAQEIRNYIPIIICSGNTMIDQEIQ